MKKDLKIQVFFYIKKLNLSFRKIHALCLFQLKKLTLKKI